MKEIKEIIRYYNLRCSAKDFDNHLDKVNWVHISENQKLSEKFIEKYQDKVNWGCISASQNLSEKFIEKHQYKVNWVWISRYQKLSENFIEKHQDKVNWYSISACQKLSEKFIEKHQDKVDWDLISASQKLSEKLIEKYQDKLDWYYISINQILSEKFIEKHKEKIDLELYRRKHKKKSRNQKIKEIKEYAKEHNLKFDGEYLYAFRDHDHFGRGMWNKTIFYKKGKYYKDWHCDMDETEPNSFGLGIFPKGNTKVKVKVDDWGTKVKDSYYGKSRVWGIEIL